MNHEIFKGKPIPSLTWYSSDGDVVDDTFSSTSTEVHNTMKIDVLTKKHFGRVYVCGAANNNRTKPAFANVTIDMKREFTISLYSLRKMRADELHQRFRFLCYGFV